MPSPTAQVALVTGASSGIGLAIASHLSSKGYVVIGTSRRPRSQSAPGLEYVELDVTDNDSIQSAISTVLARHGRIDVLVNNAGIGLSGAAEESSRGQVASLFDTNLFGLAEVTNAVLPIMRGQRSGRIVNISSVFGFNPAPNLAMYAASKFAVEGYSESLDHELRHLGIRVAIVEPGVTTSNFDSNTMPADKPMPEYDSARATAAATYEKILRSADSPTVVVAAVVRAITARSPRSRYAAGKISRQLTFARRFVPSRIYHRLIRSVNNLPVSASN